MQSRTKQNDKELALFGLKGSHCRTSPTYTFLGKFRLVVDGQMNFLTVDPCALAEALVNATLRPNPKSLHTMTSVVVRLTDGVLQELVKGEPKVVFVFVRGAHVCG